MSVAPSVTLRARTDDDLDLLYRLATDLDTWEERNPGMPTPVSRHQWDARNDAAAVGEHDARFVVDVDGETVGGASLFGVDPLARLGEIGIALLPQARGRGVGTAAIRALVQFAFVRCNLRRLHLEAIASNARAIRAYEKAGFVVEGRLREHAWVRGAYEDIVLMGVLRSESAAAAPPVTGR